MQLTSGVTIANGESVSNAIDLTDQVVTGITMPDDWDGTEITFLACDTADGTYLPVHAAGGTEFSVTTAASRHVYIDPDVTRSIKFLQLDAGTAQTPARTFTITVERTGGG